MKKLFWLLVLAMLISMFTISASAEGEYAQSPMLDAAVEAGELPPVEERLPEVPKLSSEMLDEHFEWEIGKYGGTMKHVTDDVNWDADVFVACDEALFTCASANSGEVTPNLLEDVQINEDNTEFIFKLRKGLKWSDGTEVTMEDFRFTIEDFIFNTTLTPVVSNLMRAGSSPDGAPFTAHTTYPVPFVVVNHDCKLREGGRLADIAPTMLELLGLPQPAEMDGTSLIAK